MQYWMLFKINMIQEFPFIERAEAIFATIQEEAAASWNQSRGWLRTQYTDGSFAFSSEK